MERYIYKNILLTEKISFFAQSNGGPRSQCLCMFDTVAHPPIDLVNRHEKTYSGH